MDDEGFLSADATVALLVVSFGLVIVMQAQIMALRMGRQATAARLATAGALSVLETQWPRLGAPGSRSAADGSWALRVTSEPGVDGAPRLCRLDVTYRATDARRPVQVSTQRLCDAS